jgi:DNA-binding MarR family transcriptional regulator
MKLSKDNISNESIRQFRKSLRKLERKLAERLDGNAACCGVTVSQCHVLLAIEEKKHTTVTELAAEMELDKSTLSRTIENLVGMGLVSRETNAGNRRSQHIGLTFEGEKTVSAIHVQSNGFFASVFADIPRSKHPIVVEGLALLANSLPHTTVCCAEDTGVCSARAKKRTQG